MSYYYRDVEAKMTLALVVTGGFEQYTVVPAQRDAVLYQMIELTNVRLGFPAKGKNAHENHVRTSQTGMSSTRYVPWSLVRSEIMTSFTCLRSSYRGAGEWQTYGWRCKDSSRIWRFLLWRDSLSSVFLLCGCPVHSVGGLQELLIVMLLASITHTKSTHCLVTVSIW